LVMAIIAFIIAVVFLAPFFIMAGVLAGNILMAVGAAIAIPILTIYYWIKEKLQWMTNA
jgi:hypothetical protein